MSELAMLKATSLASDHPYWKIVMPDDWAEIVRPFPEMIHGQRIPFRIVTPQSVL